MVWIDSFIFISLKVVVASKVVDLETKTEYFENLFATVDLKVRSISNSAVVANSYFNRQSAFTPIPYSIRQTLLHSKYFTSSSTFKDLEVKYSVALANFGWAMTNFNCSFEFIKATKFH